MFCMGCWTIKNIEKTIRGSISEKHVYMRKGTVIASGASITATINSSDKEKYNNSCGSHAVDKFLLWQNFIWLEK